MLSPLRTRSQPPPPKKKTGFGPRKSSGASRKAWAGAGCDISPSVCPAVGGEARALAPDGGGGELELSWEGEAGHLPPLSQARRARRRRAGASGLEAAPRELDADWRSRGPVHARSLPRPPLPPPLPREPRGAPWHTQKAPGRRGRAGGATALPNPQLGALAKSPELAGLRFAGGVGGGGAAKSQANRSLPCTPPLQPVPAAQPLEFPCTPSPQPATFPRLSPKVRTGGSQRRPEFKMWRMVRTLGPVFAVQSGV